MEDNNRGLTEDTSFVTHDSMENNSLVTYYDMEKTNTVTYPAVGQVSGQLYDRVLRLQNGSAAHPHHPLQDDVPAQSIHAAARTSQATGLRHACRGQVSGWLHMTIEP